MNNTIVLLSVVHRISLDLEPRTMSGENKGGGDPGCAFCCGLGYLVLNIWLEVSAVNAHSRGTPLQIGESDFTNLASLFAFLGFMMGVACLIFPSVNAFVLYE